MAQERERNLLYKKLVRDLKSWQRYFWTRINERLTISLTKIEISGKPMVKIVIGQDGFKFWSVAVKNYRHYKKTIKKKLLTYIRRRRFAESTSCSDSDVTLCTEHDSDSGA